MKNKVIEKLDSSISKIKVNNPDCTCDPVGGWQNCKFKNSNLKETRLEKCFEELATAEKKAFQLEKLL